MHDLFPVSFVEIYAEFESYLFLKYVIFTGLVK